QEAEGRRQKAGGRRQEAGGRRQEAGGRRQEAGGRRQKEPREADLFAHLIFRRVILSNSQLSIPNSQF
ncbi:MAG: hypothetical protein F6K41_36815, partial [Symploca sp. SIO3E6]|nr:hypothetical protein [Caldora sp. SIO3E6]